MNDFMNITKALSDQNRVRVLLALKGRELCVCQITELLGLAPSTVSKHMYILKNAGLVEWRKEGLWMHYRLPDKPAPEIRNGIEWICSSLKNAPAARKDSVQLGKILKMDLNDICRRQSGKTCCKPKRSNKNER